MPSASSSSSSSSSSTSFSSTQSQSASSTSGSSSQGSSKSKWKQDYLTISRDKGLSLRFIAYAAGASLPTTMKKMTRKKKKGGHSASDWDFFGRDTQLFWVVQPEDRQKRGRSRNPRERDQKSSISTASSQALPPEFNFSTEAFRAPMSTGGSAGIVPPPAAGGGPMVTPANGYSRASGFSFGIPSVGNMPGGSPMLPSGRN